MLIIKPYIFSRLREIIFGFSTKAGLEREAPYFFNLSYSVGDKKEVVDVNRNNFFNELGLSERTVCYQKQIHEDGIREVNSGGKCGESDALITTSTNLGLAISSADCPAIFIYDPHVKVIAAVHSGWKGTMKKILTKTIRKLKADYNSDPSGMICYVGPSISQKNYRVGAEVASLFEDKFVRKIEDKFYLDLAGANCSMLTEEGVRACNIQISALCTYEYSSLLHSYRRDGARSGRAVGVIAVKENF